MDSGNRVIKVFGNVYAGDIPFLASVLRKMNFTLQSISDILECSKNNISYHFINMVGNSGELPKKVKHPKKSMFVSIAYRKNYLVKTLFDKRYVIGYNFDDFMSEVFNTLPDKKSKIMYDFYFKGVKDTGTKRITRNFIIKKLLERNFDVNELLKEGVIEIE